MPGQRKRQETVNIRQRLSIDLGFVMDPVYGKLDILQIGDAGDDRRSFLVKGKDFGPDWRDESELISVHLSEAGRKRA